MNIIDTCFMPALRPESVTYLDGIRQEFNLQHREELRPDKLLSLLAEASPAAADYYEGEINNDDMRVLPDKEISRWLSRILVFERARSGIEMFQGITNRPHESPTASRMLTPHGGINTAHSPPSRLA